MSKRRGAVTNSLDSAGSSAFMASTSISKPSRFTSISTSSRLAGIRAVRFKSDMSTIQLKPAIPGPTSRALTERRAQAVPRGVYASAPLFIRHAENATLEDVDGNRIIDLAGGIGTNNVGNRNPRVL